MENRTYQVHYYDLDPHDVHIETGLSNILVTYKPQGFVADQLAPIVTVPKQSDRFYKMTQADLFRTEDDRRSPGT